MQIDDDKIKTVSASFSWDLDHAADHDEVMHMVAYELAREIATKLIEFQKVAYHISSGCLHVMASLDIIVPPTPKNNKWPLPNA